MKKPIPFGKYLLLERINVGGMAEVFKAKAFGVEGFERLVAVKRILPSIAEDTEFITMFIDEAKIAVQLTHANIAQIFDLGKVGDSYFIALEFVHGKDLRAIFDRARKRGEPLPVPMACFVIMKICEGLDYAHNKKDAAGRDLNLVHRDVSPQNMLISYDGEVKIIDFGIAKAAGKAGKTQAGILKGKFGYMSPEQVRGLPLDRRSDIFALGIVLYELLTGERLFIGESDFSTLEKVRNVEIMPPSTYNRRIPEELEQICLKALAKDVDDRYQTAMDLHDDLQSFMYTSGNFFARKDLAGYMRKGFSDEIAKESAREEEYQNVSLPGSSPGSLAAFDDLPPNVNTVEDLPSRRAAQQHAAPPLSANLSAQPSLPNKDKERRATLMGMPVAKSPPPPPPRISQPGPPPPPPPRISGPPPPPPSARASAPAPQAASPVSGPPAGSRHKPSGGAALDMDWDDDELSTSIYDRPEGGGLGPLEPRAPAPGPISTPLAPPPMPMNAVTGGPGRPMLGAAAAQQLGAPGGPVPMAPMPQPPSPFGQLPPPGPAFSPPVADPFSPSFQGPGPSRRETTSVSTRPKKKPTSLVPFFALAAVILLAGVAVGAYFLFFQKRPGAIQLTTNPPDAVVVFDATPLPATSSPFLINEVEPGVLHLIEVSKPGFAPQSMQVTVDPGKTAVLPIVVLRREAAEAAPAAPVVGTGFTLGTEPTGAHVVVDGRELLQRTPVQVTNLEPGPHAIRVEAPGYAPWSTQVTIVASQVTPLPRVTLVQRPVAVRFTSDPSGADVFLVRGAERRRAGSTPSRAQVDLNGGAWTVEMTRRSYDPWQGPLDVPSGESSHEVHASLVRSAQAAAPAVVATVRRRRRTGSGGQAPDQGQTPPGGGTQPGGGTTSEPGSGTGGGSQPDDNAQAGGNGTLRVNTRPWAQVFVDGRLIGNTPQMNIPLPPGGHSVTLVNSDFNIRQTIRVEIRSGQTVTRILELTPEG